MVPAESCCSEQVSLKLVCPSRTGCKMSTAGVSTVTLQWRVFLGKPYKPSLCLHSSACPQRVPCAGWVLQRFQPQRVLVKWFFFFFFAIDTWGRNTAGHDVQHILLIFQQALMQERQMREIPKGITGEEAPQDESGRWLRKGGWNGDIYQRFRERRGKNIKISELQGGKLQ